ncbi:MAG: hypothetical protein LC624_12055, partial [Halobacteriales archaeon]|nr:hypothetical protein [Halobacteriales archaeon]
MPDASEPPAVPPGGAHAADAGPLFSIDSAGERVGVAAMLVILLGTILPWGSASLSTWGPLSVSSLDLVPLTFAFLALLQLVSPGGKLGDLLMVALASVTGLAAALLQAVHDGLGGAGPGLPVTLLGCALGLGAMEMVRREAGLDYGRLAQRGVVLIQQPRVLIALLKLAIPFAIAGAF